MAKYETVFMTRQDVPAATVETLTERFTEVLKENGGDVVASEQWGLLTLQFRVKKNRKAHYTMMHIEGPAAAKDEMERLMRLDDDIIRVRTFRVDEFCELPSAMLKKDERPARGGRGGRGGDDKPARGNKAEKKETESKGDDA
ncbi:MAG: 30S ribosomal protein S6 [Alphaproteobacteria bacterium]